MEQDRTTKVLLITAGILLAAAAGGFGYYWYSCRTQPEAAVSSASAEPTAALTSVPTETPTATPTATPAAAPTPTPTPVPTATPTPLPYASLSLSSTSAESINGAEICITVTCDANSTITVSASSGITTWQEPGYLYIYPQNSGSVSVTVSESGYRSQTQTIAVTYTVQTPTPTADTSDGSLLTPTISRDDDMSFYFRGCMVDTKDAFFDTASSYGVDPYLAIAIADHETGYGQASACSEGNNFGGLTDSSGVRTYASKQEGIDALMYLLQVYNQKGRTTIAQIAAYYCPDGQELWTSRVTTIYNSFHQ